MKKERCMLFLDIDHNGWQTDISGEREACIARGTETRTSRLHQHRACDGERR